MRDSVKYEMVLIDVVICRRLTSLRTLYSLTLIDFFVIKNVKCRHFGNGEHQRTDNILIFNAVDH